MKLDQLQGVEPPRDASRQERVWAEVATRLDAGDARRRSPARARVLVAATMVAAAAAVVLAWWWPRPSTWEGSQLETAEAGQRVRLSDGTEIDVAAHSTVSACDATPPCLQVQHGAAAFHVAPQKRGTFRVRAGNVEVRVLGTRFTVKREGDGRSSSVEVEVTEGRVELAIDGAVVQTLGAGQRWATSSSQAAPVVAEGPVEPEIDPTPSPRPRAPTVVTADALWSAALTARVANDAEAEANAYRRLVTRFPRDRRVGVAAFELARLLIDVRKTPGEAISMLELALAQGERAAYVEDALMRLARAQQDVGNLAACRAARTRSLEQFPRGAHAQTIRALCP